MGEISLGRFTGCLCHSPTAGSVGRRWRPTFVSIASGDVELFGAEHAIELVEATRELDDDRAGTSTVGPEHLRLGPSDRRSAGARLGLPQKSFVIEPADKFRRAALPEALHELGAADDVGATGIALLNVAVRRTHVL